jgi:hypothetical protein
MADLIKDKVFGELKFLSSNHWGKRMDAPLYNSDGNLTLVIQDYNKEGILDVQREAYKTYLQNADKYKEIAVDYLLEYYKWNYEYIASEVSGVNENDHKDVVTETQLFEFIDLWYLFICRDGSYGYALGCCWDVDNDLAVLLSEEEPRVISRTQLEDLHKLNDDTLGLLVHDGKTSWKGLKKHSLFDKNEHLEIELEGGVDDEITEAQKKAYAEYLQKEDELFRKFTEVLEASGADRTALPKTLYIDKVGNYGWICYTEWNKGYVGILLNKEQPLFMWVGDLKTAAKYQFINDKDCGMLFTDGVSADRIEILFYDNKVYSFAMDFQLVEGELTQEQRKTYKDFMKNKAKYWEDMKDKMLDYYLCIYDDVEANFNVPKEFEKENVTRDKVLKIIKFGRIHFYEDGGGCFLGKCPIANPEGEVLGFEFTDGKIEITEPYF